ncbi:MAG: tetratricopeptide repeat protein [Alphaproteobacteria bacterium]|nr:tetratricopeptide repeat protein [Alphaproteobacteria bacterium]
MSDPDSQSEQRFSIPFTGDLSDAIQQLAERLQGLAEQGVYTKVRLSYKGAPLGKDLPIGAVVAGELASVLLMGPLRALLTTLSVGSVFDVELIYESAPLVTEAEGHIDAEQLDAAEIALRRALRRWPGDPAAHYQLGRVLEKTGRLEEAEEAYRIAAKAAFHPIQGKAAAALRALSKKTWR